MKIPLVDLARDPERRKDKIFLNILKIINNGDFVLGESVEKFEEEFSRYTQSKYCIGIGSGTDGILLTLLALDVKPRDEVIVPALTFSATVSPILMIGAKPVLVDIQPGTPFMDPDAVEKAITRRTKAIIPVHLYGGVCNMDRLKKISQKFKVPILEDACQAHGSYYKNKHAGTFGLAGIFSFYPGKNLGAYGDAGAVITDDSKLAEKLRALRNHGQIHKYVHKYLGINSRLDSIQAAVLSCKLKYLNTGNESRRNIASIYDDNLKDMGVESIKYNENINPNYHLYVIKLTKRDRLKVFLESKNIQCGIHYPLPLHINPAFNFLGGKGSFPWAEAFAEQCLSIPIFPGMTRAEINYVIENIRSFYGKV